MFAALRQYWTKLKEAEHGERFRAFYDFRKANRDSKAARVATVGVGAVLVVGGAGIGWLPGPGGFVAILGLALLAQEFRPLAAALDWTERQIVRVWRGFRGLSVASQGGIVTLVLAVSAGAVYVLYTVMFA